MTISRNAMPRPRVDLIAPPYAGHLHPILGLGRVLRADCDVRVITTPDAADRVHAADLAFHPILERETAAVWGIANTTRPVNGSPRAMLGQFKRNVRLMPLLLQDLARVWDRDPPQLSLVDFTLPGAGHAARARGIPWWTSHPSPLAIETPDGPPTYVGGNMPAGTSAQRVRQALLRRCIRLGKRAAFAWHGRTLRRLGLPGVYRRDGTEQCYSDEVTLALGHLALEFPCTWPRAVHFIGPILYTPPTANDAVPEFDPHKPNILVTLGTHLPHARARCAVELVRWASARPDWCFYYSSGGQTSVQPAARENLRVYPYVNYDTYLPRFTAVVHHGGAGIVHACLQAKLPAVVWPQDYDQFDFAARLSHHGLARWVRAPNQVVSVLDEVLRDARLKARLADYALATGQLDQPALLVELLRAKGLLAPRL
jgi:UDP:flavonoid glycosyltransferase YjiC (YdhE family)